ncbi:thyroid receptor-interacting protein 11 isoform X2 [Condylostylus longicornis]|uniref:thyroid receptor-interacting protein 11 isoform X2 n=1 Tax=Condylostylus longicornis TaxID=2530218 RepID=UPI00244DD13E|nr:thyroid receptor-interacting protein 11 isoform X2 [Condylostylus longicornis]
MSWLNNSFNTLKGQLTNLAQEVLHEVQVSSDLENEAQQVHQQQQQQQQNFLEESAIDSATQLELIEESQRKIDELNNLCGSKDNETSEKNEILEDSWCWEPDEVSSTQPAESTDVINPVASTAPENDPNSETSSSGGAEIVNIPLDSPKRNKTGDEKLNQKLNKLQEENRVLNETIQKLTNENDDLNRNLDELDSQHNLAIENVLQAKRDIQKKLTVVSKDYENQRKRTHDAEQKLQNVEIQLNEVNVKLEKLQTVYADYVTENALLKTKLDQSKKEFDTARDESLKFKDLLDKKGKELLELIEKVENDFGNEREEENALLKKKLKTLNERLDELENEKKNFEKHSESSSASSTSGKQSLDGGFIVVDDENQHTWEQKYNELLSEKSKRETEFADLERIIRDWEAKYALLQAENSNFMSKIEELKSAKIIDPNRFNELKRENEQLRQDLEASNIEYMDYQDEQFAIRKELDDKILLLEDKILDLQDRNATLENENQDQNSRIDDYSKSKLNDTESFEKLLTEKQKLELDVENSKFLNKELQVELQQQKLNYENKIADLENEVKILTQSRRSSPEQVPSTELIDMERLRSENEAFLTKISELTEKMTKCEANASDVEAKMMIENVNLRKRISDLELALTENTSDNSKAIIKESTRNSIEFDDLKKWFSTYVQIDIEINDVDLIESAFKAIKDRFWKVDVLEKNLKQMSDDILKSNSERTKLQHDITTLNADIDNYKIECEELLKNNRILLDELENYQSNKLPAISEHNEESLVQLEKQLEDIKDLNKKLDEELKQLTQKFEETELEKEESITKIQSLLDINTNLKTQIDNLNKQLDSMEAEKCNLIFEINEMKTDDKKSAVDAELFEHKAKISNLEQQLDRLNKEHTELLCSVQPQQNNLIEAKKDIERLEKLIRERDLSIVEKEKEIQKFKNEFEILQSKLIEESSTEDDKQNLIKDLDRFENEKKLINEKLENALKDVQTSNNQIEELKQEIEKLTTNNNDLRLKNDEHSETIKHSEEEIIQLRQIIESMNIEKIDIIKTLQMKHQENLQYYNEIQRLGQLLDSVNDQMVKNNTECEKCKQYQLNINNSKEEIEKLQEQVQFLKEKSDILTTNLLTEQTNQKLLQQENKDVNEQKISIMKDLERLQKHLVDQEESHTQEILEMQLNMNKMEEKMTTMEEEISKSSTALTSASIRANQQAETLQAQYSLVTQQRDELAAKISLAEDRELKNQAALVNLQCALEQFQKEKQKDIDLATAKIRKELKYEKDVQNALKTEITSLKDQLAEANQGLLAASRISDQLEQSKEMVSRLKHEIESLQGESSKLREKINTNESSQADKIEKSLIKSLIIGYIVSTNSNDKNQILKVITTVLDFDQTETDKLGLNKQQLGWFGSLLGAGAVQDQNKDSLAEAFVHFLERESQPRNDPKTLPNLLNIVTENPNSLSKERKLSQSSTMSSTSIASNMRNTSVQPILLNDNVLSDFAPTRNSSSILKDILSDS